MPIHDALLIEAPRLGIEDVVEETRRAMAEASEIVLDGFRLRTSERIFTYPARYHSERGWDMWKAVTGLLNAEAAALRDQADPRR